MQVTTFVPKTSKIASFSVDINKVTNQETGEIEAVEQVIMVLKDGTTLFAPLDAISRAMSAMVSKADLRLLRNAEIDYAVAERIAGQKFNWRPADDREFTATSDGVIQSVIGITPVDSNWAYLDTLPAYIRVRDNTKKADNHQEPEEELEVVPEGATTTPTAKAGKK